MPLSFKKRPKKKHFLQQKSPFRISRLSNPFGGQH